ncbi:MAG: methylase involved in ubiquinone/menaquinone [Planctomycetota bacterium]|nr:MAG: methylase involved in ubiquinone/menaquinone [Planctomycetota bacterium]
MSTSYRDSFGPAATRYVRSTSHSDPVSLARMCALAGASRDRLALDLACGGGHSTWALAQAGCRVVALDGTPEMLAGCGEEGKKRGLTFERAQGDAHRIPFRSGTFDIVVCRIAAHHFSNPLAALREISRVMHRKSRFYLFDLSAPDSEPIGRWLDTIETLRDPSHVCCWSTRAWEGLALGAGLRIVHSARYRRQYDMGAWLGRMNVEEKVNNEIRDRVRAVPPSWWEELSVDLNREPPVFGTPLLEFVAEKF